MSSSEINASSDPGQDKRQRRDKSGEKGFRRKIFQPQKGKSRAELSGVENENSSERQDQSSGIDENSASERPKRRKNFAQKAESGHGYEIDEERNHKSL